MPSSSLDHINFFNFISRKTLPCGGVAESSGPRSADSSLTNLSLCRKTRSEPIDITFSNRSIHKPEQRDYVVSELTSQTQFFALFLHMLNGTPSKETSNPLTILQNAQSFEKYVICYMKNWQLTYKDLSGNCIRKTEERIIIEFQRYEHTFLNQLEWKICSSLLKAMTTDVAQQLINAVKPVRQFELILTRYLFIQHCRFLPPKNENEEEAQKRTNPGLLQKSLQELSQKSIESSQSAGTLLKKQHLTPTTTLRYYLVSYYPNYQELWYPYDLILEKALIQEIEEFHQRWPSPSTVVLDYWFHPEDAENFL